MQILGLLSMHFNAVVVKVKTFLLLFRLSLAILWKKDFETRVKKDFEIQAKKDVTEIQV